MRATSPIGGLARSLVAVQQSAGNHAAVALIARAPANRVQRVIPDAVGDFVLRLGAPYTSDALRPKVRSFLIEEGAANEDVADELAPNINGIADRIANNTFAMFGMTRVHNVDVADPDLDEANEDDAARYLELQQIYQGLTWTAFKKTFRSGRYAEEEATRAGVTAYATPGPISAFVSPRVDAAGKQLITTAFVEINQRLAVEGVAAHMVAWAAGHFGELKAAFATAYTSERNMPLPPDALGDLDVDLSNNRFFELAAARVVDVIRSGDLDVFFDKTGPGASSGGTPETQSVPRSVMDAVELGTLYTDTASDKFTLSVNLAQLGTPREIAAVVFHEVMHVVGGNLGAAEGGGHMAELDDYLQPQDVTYGPVDEEQTAPIPRIVMDAYFMEVAWKGYLDHLAAL